VARERFPAREFTFEVPPRTKRDVSVIYRRVWQNGFARVTSGEDVAIEIPFRVRLT